MVVIFCSASTEGGICMCVQISGTQVHHLKKKKKTKWQLRAHRRRGDGREPVRTTFVETIEEKWSLTSLKAATSSTEMVGRGPAGIS